MKLLHLNIFKFPVEHYEKTLREYFIKNPNKNERDFLIGLLKRAQDLVLYKKNISDTEIIEEFSLDEGYITSSILTINLIRDYGRPLTTNEKITEYREHIHTDIKRLKLYILECEIRLNRLPMLIIEENFNFKNEENNISNYKGYKNNIWFKVGLLFANGEMDELLEKHNKSPKAVAEELGHSNFEKYILATMNKYKKTNTDKNIYHSRDKMNKIIKHCNENNLTVIKDFKSNLPPE